jgi:hypothetical protein
MKKTAYLQPVTDVLATELQQVLVIDSVQSNEDVTSGKEGDNSDDDNRSRQRTYNVWEDEAEEL